MSFELELDAGTLQQGDRLQEYIRRLFGVARASINEETNAAQLTPQAMAIHVQKPPPSTGPAGTVTI